MSDRIPIDKNYDAAVRYLTTDCRAVITAMNDSYGIYYRYSNRDWDLECHDYDGYLYWCLIPRPSLKEREIKQEYERLFV